MPEANSPPGRTCGFRLSISDALILVLGGITVPLQLSQTVPHVAMLVAFVVWHFFLFCNVIRARRSLELTWAVTFVVNAGVWMWLEPECWTFALALQLAPTMAIASFELRSKRYHGVGARRINPRIDQYLAGADREDSE